VKALFGALLLALTLGPFLVFLNKVGAPIDEWLAFLETHNGLVSALSSIVVAGFTWALWVSTQGLWSEAKVAGETARRAADAAARSADAAVKASMPVLFPYVTNMAALHPLEEIEQPLNHEAILLIAFDNYGKTPARIWEVRAKLFLTIADALPPEVDLDRLEEFPYQVWVPGDARGKNLDTGALEMRERVHFTPDELRATLSEAVEPRFRRFALIGKVVYDDLFGYRHTSRFCLKFRLWRAKAPGYSVVHTFQVAIGGERYNSVTSELAPSVMNEKGPTR
jgi:hypothetical protein